MGITGTPVYEACNNTIQTLQSRYNELDKQLEKLRKDADRITEKIFEIRREYKDLNQAEVNEILFYVRSYAAMLSSREIDILLCHCQNKLNGNIDSVFLTLENPKKNKEIKMIDLQKLCKITLENAEKRQKNGAKIDTDTRKMIKHCATEVVESAEAYNSMVDGVANKEIFAGEIADIICCCLIIAGKEDIDIERAIYDCVEKNERRANGIGDKL